MNNCFSGCISLKELNLLNTDNVTNFSYAFFGCTSLKIIKNLTTPKMTTGSYMFQNCISLIEIPELDFSSVTGTITYMFSSCYMLKNIIINNFSFEMHYFFL